ncbi:hypothetical protein FIBSPDRAFT_933886 [Athelia psychrophila]|uniref:Uncharacterized protein n=1 Tax=Athelia psychrophila TaxID=1759441 RepID=A0A166GC54_9AGAM|nr:hypothetical protein FIBSPDRAFT_938378 [Fibularhizoctonia sp. CBS 109695]KZP17688.1 hypothetical protein FIBSPDRAFT_933886 [Fibularhizoctonia sp. CBS 109695]
MVLEVKPILCYKLFEKMASLNNDIVISFVEPASPSTMTMKALFLETAASKDFVGIDFVEVDLSQADQHLQSIAAASGFVSGSGIPFTAFYHGAEHIDSLPGEVHETDFKSWLAQCRTNLTADQKSLILSKISSHGHESPHHKHSGFFYKALAHLHKHHGHHDVKESSESTYSDDSSSGYSSYDNNSKFSLELPTFDSTNSLELVDSKVDVEVAEDKGGKDAAYNPMATPVRSDSPIQTLNGVPLARTAGRPRSARSDSGDHLDRGGKHMSGLWGRAKRIDDPQANYLIPRSASQWFYVAKVSIGLSFFQVLCRNQGDTIDFRVEFAPDTLKGARVSAAIFHVRFIDDADITISKISPINYQGNVIRVHNTTTFEKTGGAAVAYAGVGVTAAVDNKINRSWDDDTSLQVKGWGADTLDAHWTFLENHVHGGLDAQHFLSVNLAGRTRNNTKMCFWAQAKLASGLPIWERMEIGSQRKPYVRCLGGL